MSSTSVLSKTLQSITGTKIRELEKQRTQYESRKTKILQEAEKHTDQGDRISCLLRGVKELYTKGRDDDPGIDNIDNLLTQSKYDSSVPHSMLQSSEDLLRSKLDVQSHKLSMAHLYSRLVTEWINPGSPMEDSDSAELSKEDSSFEVIDQKQERLQNLRDQFEKVVFTPLETDESEINAYLASLLKTRESERALERVRQRTARASEDFLKRRNPFNTTTLKMCIASLLQQDLLSDEKQAILREFESNNVVLREIADVLNTRFVDFENWEWDAGEEGVSYVPRQQANGKYRIWMDEDVLQAIFIHWIGINSCVSLKRTLTDLVSLDGTDQVWRWHAEPPMTERQMQRRAYYLSELPMLSFGLRRKNFIDHFCLAALPSQVNTLNEGMYDDGRMSEEEDDDDVSSSEWGKAKKPALNIKQFLLRTLATETMLHQALDGTAAAVQSDLKWFGAGLSHTSIFAVLRFFGFPENMIAFYRKVLETPVNLGSILSSESESPSNAPRIRRRGMPMSRSPAKLIGELVLFVMDFAVNQETGLQLYRLHDDLWVAGSPADTARAWATMQHFAKVMGLEFNMKKTGSVYLTNEGVPRDEALDEQLPKGPVSIGHLVLDPKSGKWTIDQANVAEHVKQLQKQLAECRSILDWVRTWNSCIGRFFGQAFGEPAYCLGKEHVESVLQTYQKMQHDIFAPYSADTGDKSIANAVNSQLSAVHYIKSKIEQRFSVSDVSDAFIFFPDQLGGLELQNQFIPFLKVQKHLCGTGISPEEMIQSFFDRERKDYEDKKSTFMSNRATEARELGDELFGRFDAQFLSPEDLETFFTYEEFTENRSTTSSHLRGLYERVQGTPTVLGPKADRQVYQALEDLPIQSANLRSELRWVVQMYHQEAKERFDGLRLIEERFLPLGVIDMMRQKTVRWGLVL
ncbi:putative polyketide synthase [Colletotrichum scovillei]|nr:putative polyketide synthase [Colletotrichum scovillei]